MHTVIHLVTPNLEHNLNVDRKSPKGMAFLNRPNSYSAGREIEAFQFACVFARAADNVQ